MDRDTLLKQAVEDNVAWCAAVSATHGAQEIATELAWANLAKAPRYYPNVITRAPGVEPTVTELVGRLHGPRPWSVKDSFRDLDLRDLAFAPVIEAQWFGGIPISNDAAGHPWERIHTPDELMRWVDAWGEGAEASPFKPGLLADPRIGFWQLRRNGAVTAGGITFASGPVIGLSNWFARENETVFTLGLTSTIAQSHPGVAIVLWSADEEAGLAAHGLTPLGPMRIWTAF